MLILTINVSGEALLWALIDLHGEILHLLRYEAEERGVLLQQARSTTKEIRIHIMAMQHGRAVVMALLRRRAAADSQSFRSQRCRERFWKGYFVQCMQGTRVDAYQLAM